MPYGKIITIEGTDGTGKQTQTELLVKRAQESGYQVFTMSFPDYTSPWGQKIQQYKEGKFGTLSEVDPKNACWLYALDRELAKPRLERLLDSGCNIIMDRYTESNYAHQGSKLKGEERNKMIEWIRNLETRILEIPKSDAVIFLDLPVEHSFEAVRKRNEETGNKTEDMHEENMAYLRETYETYKMLATQEDWITIPCINPETSQRYTREELAETIWKIAEPKLVKPF